MVCCFPLHNQQWHIIRRHKIRQKLPLLFWLAAGPHERWLCNSAGSVLRVLWITPAGTVENLVKQLRPLAFHRKWENTTTGKMGKYRNIWHMWGIGKQRWWKRGKDMITSLSYLCYVWLHGLFNLFLVEAYVFLTGKGVKAPLKNNIQPYCLIVMFCNRLEPKLKYTPQKLTSVEPWKIGGCIETYFSFDMASSQWLWHRWEG